MKRAFLFGLGSFLIFGIIYLLVHPHDKLSIITALILVPVSVIAIRAARRAPPNRSRLHAVGGWLLGFLVVDAVMLAVVGIIWIIWRAVA
jgi:hypothetical protein